MSHDPMPDHDPAGHPAHGSGSDHGSGSGHESRDVETRTVATLAAWLGALLVTGTLASLGLFAVLRHQAVREGGMAPPLAARPLPPEPRLQVAPAEDLERLRAEEERWLHSYGWVDRERGRVRIPIERAMDLVAEEGLPHE